MAIVEQIEKDLVAAMKGREELGSPSSAWRKQP